MGPFVSNTLAGAVGTVIGGLVLLALAALGFDQDWMRRTLPAVLAGWAPYLRVASLTLAFIGTFYAGCRLGTKASRPAGSANKAATAKPKISIIVGQGGNYERVQQTTQYTIHRTAHIGVRNDGSTLLTNCKVFCEAHRPEGTTEKFLCENTFTLNVGEERYVSVAGHTEATSRNTVVPDMVQLSAPPSGTFWRPPALPGRGGAITLTAESTEAPRCSVVCNFWIEHGKLHWKQL